MRTSEERVEELHHRMKSLERERNRRRYTIMCAAALSACLVITVSMAFVISMTTVQSPTAYSGGVSASIFADHGALGYVITALLAFCLGATVTIFCFRLQKHEEKRR